MGKSKGREGAAAALERGRKRAEPRDAEADDDGAELAMAFGDGSDGDGADDISGDSGDDGGSVGGKRKSMASAFARILGKRSKAAVPILAERRDWRASQEEKIAADKRRRAAEKRQRERAIREQGHVRDVRAGTSSDRDDVERALLRTATRGVVKLFNAVHQAQRGAAATTGKASTREGKARLLAALDGAAKNASTLGTFGGTDAAAAAMAGQAAGGTSGSGGRGAGWSVLNDGFTGLSGGKKLKDWDREEGGADDDAAVEDEAELDDSDSDEYESDEGEFESD